MRLTTFLLASLFATGSAFAGEINGLHYGSLSLSYTHASLKFVNDNGEAIKFNAFKGFTATAEAIVADRVLLSATYGQLKSSNASTDGVAENVKSENSITIATVGYRFEAGKGIDVIPFIEYRGSKFEVEGDPTDNSKSTAAGVQLRAALNPSVEVHLSVSRDDDKVNAIGGRALHKFDKNWAVFLGHSRESGPSSYRGSISSLGVSYLF
jgi:predicted porin